MLRVTDASGVEKACWDREGFAVALDVCNAIKKQFGIPRGEQRLALGTETLRPMARLPHGELFLVLTRAPIFCQGCGFKQADKKLRVCSGCYNARYCDEACQRKDWVRHKPDCERQ